MLETLFALHWLFERAKHANRKFSQRLPALLPHNATLGHLKESLAAEWGVESVPVSVGGGDNMMSAIGAGAVREGVWVISLGTSGTLFGRSDKAVVDERGEFAPFCDSAGAWLPLMW